MERIEYFRQEIAKQQQMIRDAKMLVRGPGQLLKVAERIAKERANITERKLRDFV